MMTRKNDMDPIFSFEKANAPIAAEIAYQKADKATWENSVFLLIVALAMAALDSMFLFDMLDLVMQQNELLGKIGAIGIALILNLTPLEIAKQVNKARYGLDNESWIFAVIGIFVFMLLYTGVVILRFHCLELYTSSAVETLKNTAALSAASETVESVESMRRPIFAALLLSLEPLATSGFSFVLAIMTDNPLEKQIDYLKKRKLELKSLHNRFSTALASMIADKEFLINCDNAQYEAAKEMIEADAERLKTEARMMLAEKLKDPSSVSALAASEPAPDKDETIPFVWTEDSGVETHSYEMKNQFIA